MDVLHEEVADAVGAGFAAGVWHVARWERAAEPPADSAADVEEHPREEREVVAYGELHGL